MRSKQHNLLDNLISMQFYKKVLLSFLALGLLTAPVYAATFDIETPVALFSTSLVSKISTTATSMQLVSGLTYDGVNLASSTYSFIIDEGTAAQEFVKADCTAAVCTNMQRGLSAITGTTTIPALEQIHLRGASVKITDAAILLNLTRILQGIGMFPSSLFYSSNLTVASSTNQIPYAAWIYNNFVNKSEAQTVNGAKSFTGAASFAASVDLGSTKITSLATPTAPSDGANKSYVDGVALVSAPNADTVTKGVTEEATVAEINAATAAGSTGAQLFVNPAFLAVSTYASTTVALTEMPRSGFPSNTQNIIPLFDYKNTSLSCGQITFPTLIKANSFSVEATTIAGRGGAAGNVKFALFAENGSTQLFATTTFISTAGVNTFPLASQISISPGNYYLCVVPVGTADVDLRTYQPLNTAILSFTSVSGKPYLQGTTTVSAGAMPSTISPNALTATTYNIQSTLITRFDN